MRFSHFHALAGYVPFPCFQIELAPFGAGKLGGADKEQGKKTQRALHLKMSRIVVQFVQKHADFFIGNDGGSVFAAMRAYGSAKVNGNVARHSASGNGVAENHAAILDDSVGDKFLSLFFKRLEYQQQVLRCDFGNGLPFQGGEKIVPERVQFSFPVFFGIVDGLRFMPFKDNILEGIGFREKGGVFHLFLVPARINAVGKQFFRLISLCPRILQGDNRIFPETEQLFLVVEAVRHTPEF